MQITQPNLTWLFNAWNLTFQSAYKATTPWWSNLATKRTSTGQQETYAWASRTMQLREWGATPPNNGVITNGTTSPTGVNGAEREMRSIGTYNQTIVNRDFESTIEIDRNMILDDTFGIFNFSMGDLGRAAAKFPDVLALNVLLDGQSQSCYDGQNFFSTSHPIDLYGGQISASTLQSNYFTGTPLTFDNYLAVRQTMMQYKGEDGLPLGVVPNLLVVGPDLEVVGRLITEGRSVAPQTLNGQTQVGANDNPLEGTAKLLVIPELGQDPGSWFMADTSKGVRALIWQERQAPNVITLRDPSSENVFKRKKFAFGVDIRGNVAGGLWWLMAKAHS